MLKIIIIFASISLSQSLINGNTNVRKYRENLNPGKILSEMTSKDVHHFIDTFNKYFSRLCKMELKDERVKLIVKLKTIDEFNYKIGADK